tara:strand:- start:912 stop:2528 length:1617 start_codon:yes stop_codon:yes gene_type:complete
MANGRLGKAAVAPGATSAIYTNSSGAEASVSVVAFAELATNLDIRIDTTSNAVTETLNAVSETYDVSYVQYSISNTGFTDSGAMAYIGRVQANAIIAAGTYRIFEFYSNANSTLYTTEGTANTLNSTSQSRASYSVYTSEQIDTGGDIVIQDPSPNSITVKSYPVPTTEDEYYKIIFNRTASASHTYTREFASNAGGHCLVVDPYPLVITGSGGAPDGKLMHWTVAMGSSNMGAMFKYTGNTFELGEVSGSSTLWYRTVNSTSSSTPSANFNHPYLRPQRRMLVIDSCGSGSDYISVCTMPDSTWNDTNVATAAERSVKESNNAVYRLSVNSKSGGSVLFHEYNPNDGKHYIAVRNNSVVKLFTTDRDTILGIGAGQRNNGNLGTDDDYATYVSDFSLNPSTFTLAGSSTAIGNTTCRSMRIGTSLWVLIISQMASATQEEVFYSTDLITWTDAATYYGSDDYSATEGVATITSNSGAVTATKTRIGVLGTDGILEQNLSMVQYERTGIVLSNGDRILVRNRGTTQTAVVQVMGYEGT